MSVILIAAVGRNGVIGRDNDLPWRIREDLQHFKQLTLGHTLVMGRKTYDSIGRPLPGRRTVVVTRQPDWSADGVDVTHSLEEAFKYDGTLYVAGGGEIYRQALPYADRPRTHRGRPVPRRRRHLPGTRPARPGSRPPATPTTASPSLAIVRS